MQTLSIYSDLNGFVLPNVNTLKESKKNINTVALSFNTNFIQDLQIKCKRLSTLVSELSLIIQDDNAQIRAELGNQSIDSYLNEIQEILVELQKPDLSEEDRLALQEGEQELKNLLNREITNIRILVEEKEKRFSSKLHAITDILIKERLGDVITEKERQKTELINTISQKENRKQELIDERKVVIDSLDIMREENLFDIFKDMLPTDQDIEKLDLTQPKKAALQEGIRLYRKLFENISNGLEYAKLADHKDDLTNRISEIGEEIRAENRRLQEFEDELRDTSKMITISDQRSIYVEEVAKIIRSFRFFYCRLDSLSKIQATVYTEIKQLFTEMLNYLNQIVSL
ncbi:alpha-xenorhabdolysin family binary toxin subunit B [Nostoc sp. CENA67]|uniref:Alpha-xenorhabdolysin family binary toxin subunit B n=1 Tax=Amazonocrinis nigriterrae CENA67 TaxID=2794033 RepID=A0A8J7LBX5_9NOST|nr:alpha-xenorhabdolysin family binary toxin subunit B [Amazonocrinis nigriterrae]MBH8565891.1 alpha-xenorhabdolysin family binary toxin subunit B [Amazonocrinis nigriterrae CENA67]